MHREYTTSTQITVKSKLTLDRGLLSRARFEQDEARRDWRAIPELAGLVYDYFIMVPLLVKIREKSRK